MAKPSTVFLMYHELALPNRATCHREPGYTRYVVSASDFRRHIARIAAEGWRGLNVTQAMHSFGGKSVCITFDDGCETDVLSAAPMLKDFGFGATSYITVRVSGPSWIYVRGASSRLEQRWDSRLDATRGPTLISPMLTTLASRRNCRRKESAGTDRRGSSRTFFVPRRTVGWPRHRSRKGCQVSNHGHQSHRSEFCQHESVYPDPDLCTRWHERGRTDARMPWRGTSCNPLEGKDARSRSACTRQFNL